MKKTLLSAACAGILCMMAFFLLIPATASADQVTEDTYPGLDKDHSYWALCTFSNEWGPVHNLKSVSRFSIGGNMVYDSSTETFTYDRSKMVDYNQADPLIRENMSGVAELYGLTEASTDAVFAYKDTNTGFIFVPADDNGKKFKIHTLDGVYLKRGGSGTSPKLVGTTDESSATAFTVEAAKGGFMIYEKYSIYYAGLQLNSDGDLKLKRYDAYLDVGWVSLYRRGYSANCYLYGRMIVPHPDSYRCGYRGPFTPETRTGAENKILTLPCYYNGSIERFVITTSVEPTMSGVAVTKPSAISYLINGQLDRLTWTVTVDDAPSNKLTVTYTTAAVTYQEHNFKVVTTEYNGELYDSDCRVVKDEPTCEKPGTQYRPCMNYVDWETDPTDPSKWDLENNPCKAYQSLEEIPALGHVLETIVYRVPANCEYPAFVQGPCARCDRTNIRIYDESQPALGHDLELHPAKAPTCVEQGNEAYYICVRDTCPWAHSNLYLTDMNGTRIYGIPTIPIDPDAHAMEDRCTLSEDGSVLTVTSVCAHCGSVSSSEQADLVGKGTAGAPWQIGSAAHWDLIRAAMELGFDTSGKYFVLTDNISVTTMIGSEDHPFSGHFDGAGHTLTVNYTATEQFCAPFRYVDGATIEKLTVTGTITTGYISAAGFVGKAANSCTITNCVSNVNIISYVTSANEHGGFVATATNTRIEGCVYTGSITGNNLRYCAGFLNRGDNSCLCVNCIFAPDSFPTDNCANFCRWGNAGDNCYYFTFLDSGRETGKQACFVQGGDGVTLDFGTPTVDYNISEVKAYASGLAYGKLFYAGMGESVTFGLPAELTNGYNVTLTASAGTLTCADGAWTLTMPDEDVVISAEFTTAFGPATFTLPADLTAIKASAFEGDMAITVVDAHNVDSIGAKAFKDCTGLKQIRLPQDCQIDSTAFSGCNEVCIFAPAGGDTQNWCSGQSNVVFVEEAQH